MDPQLWNSILSRLPYPHFLQTYEWGQVKSKYGWSPLSAVWTTNGRFSLFSEPDHCSLNPDHCIAAALILKRQILSRGFAKRLSIFYTPKGPLLDWSNVSLRTHVLAASAMGFRGETVFKTGTTESLDISLVRTTAVRTPLFEAIPRRQATRGEFDAKPLSNDELRLLETAGSGNGVRVHLLTDKQAMENVLDLVVQGNTAQMRAPAFVRELKDWIRFNGGQAARQGDGLFSGSSGNPRAPSWLGGVMFDFFFTEKAENDKYARHVRSSAGIAVFVTDERRLPRRSPRSLS